MRYDTLLNLYSEILKMIERRWRMGPERKTQCRVSLTFCPESNVIWVSVRLLGRGYGNLAIGGNGSGWLPSRPLPEAT